MPGTPRPAVLTTLPDTYQESAGAAAPNRSGELIALIGRLVDYGKGLVSAVRQCASFADLPANAQCFHTGDIALIVAHITRGLMRAAALQAWLIIRGERQPRAAPAGGV